MSLFLSLFVNTYALCQENATRQIEQIVSGEKAIQQNKNLRVGGIELSVDDFWVGPYSAGDAGIVYKSHDVDADLGERLDSKEFTNHLIYSGTRLEILGFVNASVDYALVKVIDEQDFEKHGIRVLIEVSELKKWTKGYINWLDREQKRIEQEREELKFISEFFSGGREFPAFNRLGLRNGDTINIPAEEIFSFPDGNRYQLGFFSVRFSLNLQYEYCNIAKGVLKVLGFVESLNLFVARYYIERDGVRTVDGCPHESFVFLSLERMNELQLRIQQKEAERKEVRKK